MQTLQRDNEADQSSPSVNLLTTEISRRDAIKSIGAAAAALNGDMGGFVAALKTGGAVEAHATLVDDVLHAARSLWPKSFNRALRVLHWESPVFHAFHTMREHLVSSYCSSDPIWNRVKFDAEILYAFARAGREGATLGFPDLHTVERLYEKLCPEDRYFPEEEMSLDTGDKRSDCPLFLMVALPSRPKESLAAFLGTDTPTADQIARWDKVLEERKRIFDSLFDSASVEAVAERRRAEVRAQQQENARSMLAFAKRIEEQRENGAHDGVVYIDNPERLREAAAVEHEPPSVEECFDQLRAYVRTVHHFFKTILPRGVQALSGRFEQESLGVKLLTELSKERISLLTRLNPEILEVLAQCNSSQAALIQCDYAPWRVDDLERHKKIVERLRNLGFEEEPRAARAAYYPCRSLELASFPVRVAARAHESDVVVHKETGQAELIWRSGAGTVEQPLPAHDQLDLAQRFGDRFTLTFPRHSTPAEVEERIKV